MPDVFQYISIGLSLVSLVLVCLVMIRLYRPDGSAKMEARLDQLERILERQERALRDEIATTREEMLNSARLGREEMTRTLAAMGDSLSRRIAEIGVMQKNQLEVFAAQLKNMTASNEARMDKLRDVVDQRLLQIQDDTAKKLELMRATVDEKLHDTLERRLGESFKLVSERLELVQKGLGEMQSLASGVGDLKKVLTNVKTRGILGEIQLGSLLEQILAPGQYDSNVEIRPGSGQRVEFALKLPGRAEVDGEVWLPIDAKFPLEDYMRLVEAQEQGDALLANDAGKLLERAVRESARNIRDKYLDPPRTTDFGVMFLPTEGLYAEILRRPGLFDLLQRDYKVIVTGPTTLAALLNSLQMGFRTLAIEKRSSEVWNMLGAVRTEFAKFGQVLDKTRKKLQEAGNQIEQAATRSRVIERKLRDVQGLPPAEAEVLLDLPSLSEENSEVDG